MSVSIYLKFQNTDQINSTLDKVSLKNEWISFDGDEILFDNIPKARYGIDEDNNELLLDTNSSLYNYIGAAAYLIANQAQLSTITDAQDGRPEPPSNYQKYVNLVLTDLANERLKEQLSGELFTAIVPKPTTIFTKEKTYQTITQLNASQPKPIFKFGFRFLEYIDNDQPIRLWFFTQSHPLESYFLRTAKDWRSNSKFIDNCQKLAELLGGKVITLRPNPRDYTEEELLNKIDIKHAL